jgi:multidrug efflux pump subunit AcrB
MRFNGKPAIGISLAPLPAVNVVQVGRAVDKRLQVVVTKLPVGIEVEKISWQSDLVDESIQAFMINLVEAILIVLVVLALTMGIRVGVIIGVSGLVFPILGTFIVMSIMAIDLQRISLGALIIAMGMMVDNAIVVADGIIVRLQAGMERTKAAIESASQPAMPLLGATVVACMAFYPIFASPFSTGEYARSLFVVVAISLLFSWVLSQTVTPLMCIAMIPDPKKQEGEVDVYEGRFYQIFKGLLVKAIRYRVLFMGGLTALLVAAILGFGNVKQMYFPDASRLQFMIDYWLPEGTRIQEVSADFQDIEKKLMDNPLVDSVSSFIGSGPPRFYLPVDPEMPYKAYGQLIVNTRTLEDIETVMEEIDPWLKENKPYALSRVRKYKVGSFDDWMIEARFSGPAEADPDILRALAEKGKAILEASPWAKEVRSDWRQRERKIIPSYSQERGRWAGVSRDDVARATKRAYDGLIVGLFREGDDLIPIVFRHREDERQAAATSLDTVQVVPALSTKTVPLSQVSTGIDVVWEDPIIWRWDRRRAITVQCSPDGVSADALRSSVVADFEAIELPPGYTLEWDGEYDSKQESMSGLIPGIVPGVVIMVFIIVLLFNAFRPPLIIFLVIPFAVIGITAGLLGTGVPFGFMALLGAMSLSGMMIKNAVVLLDQINLEQAAGKSPYRAVIDSAISRLRPVVNAAATTIFGMAPLLQDVFWVSMAITIMFGLAFGTVLTMVVVPALYALFFKVKEEA